MGLCWPGTRRDPPVPFSSSRVPGINGMRHSIQSDLILDHIDALYSHALVHQNELLWLRYKTILAT